MVWNSFQCLCVMFRIEEVRKSTEKVGGNLQECKGYFVEIGCLFVINQGSVFGSKSCDDHVRIM